MRERKRRQPEAILQGKIIDFLTLRQWYVMNMCGNEFQSGVPDLYAAHKTHGPRWIEVKRKESYNFTDAQLDVFPELTAKRIGIWILVAPTDAEYRKLFQPANWYAYLKG